MSKKLENNGIWESSRMMLPQHREELLKRRSQQPDVHRPPRREDLELMRDSVLLPVMISIVKKRIQAIEASGEALKHLYSKVAQVLLQDIQKDLSKVERTMLDERIHVAQEGKDTQMIWYRYTFHGYEDTFTITRDYMRTEVSVRIGRYSDRLITALYARLQEDPKQK